MINFSFKNMIILFIIISVGLYSYEKTEVLRAYKILTKTFSYRDNNGTAIKVKKVKYRCRNTDCILLGDDREIDIDLIINEPTTEHTGVDEETPIENNQPSIPSGNESGIMKGMAEAHNYYRRKLNLPDLTWDTGVEKYAQNWANQLQSSGCAMNHRNPNKYGENLAWASGMFLNPKQVVKMWYDEIKDYHYPSNSCNPGAMCGHFTQVVWKKSLRLGCGMAKCGREEIWVCNYDPPGNYVGEKPY